MTKSPFSPRRTFLQVLIIGLFAYLGLARVQAQPAAAPAAAKQPNIIQIIADDLGWKDVGFNGCQDIKTPNIDGLAAAGARFSQFYVQTMCTPSRAALMTGRYPFRYGLQTSVIPGPAGYGLDTSEWLMPQALKPVTKLPSSASGTSATLTRSTGPSSAALTTSTAR